MKYSTGDVILTSEPLLYAVNQCFKGKVCDRCLTKWDGLKRCSGCKCMFYCSLQCQHADWKEVHKYECVILRVQPTQGFPAIICNLIRMCIKYQYSKAISEKTWMMYDGTQRMIGNLISRTDVRTDLHETRLTELTNNLNSFGIVVSKDTLIYRFGQVIGNILAISDEMGFIQQEHPCVACGLYVEASTFDHSCRPNAMCIFNGPVLTIRALTEIDTDKEKITISYIDGEVILPRVLRQAEIRNFRYFDCLCDICTDKNYSDAPRDELIQLITRMRTAMNKEKTNEVVQVSGRVFSLIQSIFGRYSKSYIQYMLFLVEFKCKQLCKNGMRNDVDGKTTWMEFESCLRKTHGTDHPFYKACSKYGEFLMSANTPHS